jgi:hypothetical protein
MTAAGIFMRLNQTLKLANGNVNKVGNQSGFSHGHPPRPTR